MAIAVSRKIRVAALASVAAFAFVPFAAAAQDADATSDEEDRIIVTGTLIRGEAPVGSNLITIGPESLQETGATSGNELLANLPQVTNYFNDVPVADLAIAVNQIQISRPNIREITPSNAAASGTLILFDGHRIASAGVNQASIDPDVIPVAAIARVDVVTEGGSAIYGADAVAGVINFITRRRFDGIEVDGSYGFADNYWQWDVNAIAGTDWGNGSAYVAYSYNRNRALFGRDRDFIRNLNYATQPYTPVGRNCANPNLSINYVLGGNTITSITAAAPNFTSGTFNACDTSDHTAIVPEAERHGGLLSVSQDFSDTLSLDFKAFYSERDTFSSREGGGQARLPASFAVPAGLPPSIPVPTPFGTFQALPVATGAFSFAPALGTATDSHATQLAEWGINLEARKEFGNGWEISALANYSATDSAYQVRGANATRLNAVGASGALNPFNIAATPRSVLDDLFDNELAGQAKDELLDFRVIAQGTLFALPGGDVRVAFGAEFMEDTLQLRTVANERLGVLQRTAFTDYERQIWSGFGEVLVPVFDMLEISLAGRYDDYEDFGSTFNPKIGATFSPADWFHIRGNWGTSFTAPTPLDQLKSAANTVTAFPFVAFPRPGDTIPAGSQTVALQGSVPGLMPQEADTWSIGFDADPPFLGGLRLSGSYYNVAFSNILSTPTPSVGIFTDFPNNITTNVNGIPADQLRAFMAQGPGGAALAETLITNGIRVYELVDFRTGNFGILNVEGLDFAVNYRADTGFGGIDAALSGNYQLSREQQVSPTAATVDALQFNVPKLRLRGSLGADIGQLRASATVSHTGGYDIVPLATTPVQNHVSGFTTVDLFFKYDLPQDDGPLAGLSFTLNIDNLFNQDPPAFFGSGPGDNGYANGFTFGRMFVIGVRKRI